MRANLLQFGRVVSPQLPSAPSQALELLDSTISPGAIVVAHSMGAVLAMRLAKSRPLASLLRLALLPAGLEEALAVVTPSVLIIHARDDHHVPIDYAIAAQRRRQGWTLEVLDQGGHHAHVNRPAAWSSLATRWLARAIAN